VERSRCDAAPDKVAALRQALRIFDRAALDALMAEHAAGVLESVAVSLEERGRAADTPPEGRP
jgi:hypothetical protein